jgi:hypothetical protein
MGYELMGETEVTFDTFYGDSLPRRYADSERVRQVYRSRGDGTVYAPGRSIKTLRVDRWLRVFTVHIDANNDYAGPEIFWFTEEHGWAQGSIPVHDGDIETALAAIDAGRADGIACYMYAGEIYVYAVSRDVLRAIQCEKACYKQIPLARDLIPAFKF